MNQKELAGLLNVSSTAVGNWVKEGMPVESPGKQGRPARFDLAKAVQWLEARGKGYSLRRDRPGNGETRIKAVAVSLERAEKAAAELPPLAKSAVIAKQIREAEKVLDFLLENFPILAAALIRFHGMTPADALETAFCQADMFDKVARCALGIPDRTTEHPRIHAFLQGDRAKLEENAASLIDLWDLEGQE